MKYYCIMVVWGQEYTDMFLEAAIANQLQPGNLPALSRQASVIYAVHTTSQDAARILAHPAFQQLTETVNVRLEVDDTINLNHHRYQAMSVYHAKALKMAGKAAILFLAPDLFFSNGAFTQMHALHLQGKRLIMIPALRALKEDLVENFLAAEEARKHGETVVFSPRELVGMLMAHPHPSFSSLQHDSPCFGSWPAHIYWQAGDEGFVVRAFFLHPLMVAPEAMPALGGQTVDGGFLDVLAFREEDVYVVQDSDEIIAIDLTRKLDHNEHQQVPNRLSLKKLRLWARANANPRRLRFFQQRIAIRATDPSQAWTEAETAADAWLDAFMKVIGPTR